jgi:integrase
LRQSCIGGIASSILAATRAAASFCIPGVTCEYRSRVILIELWPETLLHDLRMDRGEHVWLSRHLGHSSLKVTTDTYGHWEAAERKREARQMAGVFGV